MGSALSGVTLEPKGDEEVTAVPPNSTPTAPFPETGSYLKHNVKLCFADRERAYVVVSLGSKARCQYITYVFHPIKLTGEVRYPISMRVPRQNDSIVDMIIIEMAQNTISVGSVAVPCVLCRSLSSSP